MKNEVLDIIIPISLDAGGRDVATVEQEITDLKERYGFTKFAIFAPGKGFRSTHYPSKEDYADIAARLCRSKPT
jgi:hypothetical protein